MKQERRRRRRRKSSTDASRLLLSRDSFVTYTNTYELCSLFYPFPVGRVAGSPVILQRCSVSWSKHKESERCNATGKWPLYAMRCQLPAYGITLVVGLRRVYPLFTAVSLIFCSSCSSLTYYGFVIYIIRFAIVLYLVRCSQDFIKLGRLKKKKKILRGELFRSSFTFVLFK